MKLPSPIQIYFEADQDVAGPAPIAAFTTDAVVKDEGRTHVGPKAIGAWWRAAKAQFQHTTDPREISEADGRFTVLAEVSGQFPGSPAMLNFTFTLKDDAISILEIGA
ncbi:nuclear transport factor 2 family protein [Oleisolibacter albus]|uniref:nuclear transport factor 2 family protein n=1 Tax=Oleisolibacter albus TaxID=2171757 RepID=UPI000DF17A49|nr:nuclear transport factor 2 family protein [Oleisolibacter albus]